MPITDFTVACSRVRDLAAAAITDFRTAVSLHAHTHHSSENMACVPGYLDRIPLVRSLFRRELRAYVERNGEAPDFTKGWWHPPCDPMEVLDSESAQITGRLALRPLVSITDHDSIAAGLELRGRHLEMAAISCEWTVPLERGFLHLGVHNLRLERAEALFGQLAACTARPTDARIALALDALTADPTVLVVLNHPLWDLAGIGAAAHVRALTRFLAAHRASIHALELNGYRSWRENHAVCALAAAQDVPLVAGGDRHGAAPNALLNLTTATSFADFVGEVRDDRRTDLLILPEYREPLVTRKLGVARDVVRHDPAKPSGRREWMDRVTCEVDGHVGAMREHWPDGGPMWVRAAVGAFVLLTGPAGLPLVRALVAVAGASTSHHAGPAALVDGTAAPAEAVGDAIL